MAPMGFVRLDTVDAMAAEAVCEALVDAGIGVEVAQVQSFEQLAYLQHQSIPQVDLLVAPEERERAAEVLRLFQDEIGEALAAEASGTSSRVAGVAGAASGGRQGLGGAASLDDGLPDGGAATLSGRAPADMRTDHGLLLALLMPFPAGVLYAGRPGFGLALLGITAFGVAAVGLSSALGAPIGAGAVDGLLGEAGLRIFHVLVVAKLVDLLATPILIWARRRQVRSGLQSGSQPGDSSSGTVQPTRAGGGTTPGKDSDVPQS